IAVLVEAGDARGTRGVPRIARLIVVGAFIAVALADVDVAVGTEGDRDRLPQQALPLALIPVAALAPGTDRLQHSALGADLHADRAAEVADPRIVLRVDVQAVR